jgi:hypothetical protein
MRATRPAQTRHADLNILIRRRQRTLKLPRMPFLSLFFPQCNVPSYTPTQNNKYSSSQLRIFIPQAAHTETRHSAPNDNLLQSASPLLCFPFVDCQLQRAFAVRGFWIINTVSVDEHHRFGDTCCLQLQVISEPRWEVGRFLLPGLLYTHLFIRQITPVYPPFYQRSSLLP